MEPLAAIAIVAFVAINERDKLAAIWQRVSGSISGGESSSDPSRQQATEAVETLIRYAESHDLDEMNRCARHAGKAMWGECCDSEHKHGEAKA